MQKFYYPVCETKEEFEKYWKIDNFHGATQSYGFHDGWDINLKTGGDTDLGKQIYACLPFKRKFFHYNSHLTSGFGRHILNEVVAPFDNNTYWLHFAHMEEGGPELTDGQAETVIGTIGQTGRPRGQMLAHLHFAIFKKLPEKLDMIATSKDILDEYWVDPKWFFEQLEKSTGPMITIPVKERDELIKRSSTLSELEKEGYINLQAITAIINGQKESYSELKKEYDNFILKIVEKLNPTGELAPITDKNYALQLIENLISEIDSIRGELKKQESKWQKESQVLIEENKVLTKEINSLKEEIIKLREQHQLEITDLTTKHNLELDRLEKRIEQVSNTVEKNQEKREESKEKRNFILDLIKKYFLK